MSLLTKIVGFEVVYHRELVPLAPINQGPILGSPSGSWLATTTSPPPVTSPLSSGPSAQVNGTSRVRSPTLEARPARQDKKRLSLAFFKGGSGPETPRESKSEKPAVEENQLEKSSTTASSRSRSKERKTTNRLSLNFLVSPQSPPPEALPHFPTQSSSNVSLNQGKSREQSTERRPNTSKSGKSDKSDHTRKGSVRKRFSILNIGKKSSKNDIKGRVNDTVAEE